LLLPAIGFWGCAGDWEEKLEVGEDLKVKGLVKSWGTYGFIYRPGEKDRGAYPEKLGRWRGFLDQLAVRSFGIQSWVVFG
jgi:hypothetical protein